MNNLQKFDNSISELETEINNFKEIGNVFKKMKTIADVQENIILRLSSTENAIQGLLSDFQKFKKDTSENVDRLREDNKRFYRDIEETIRIKLSENKSEIKSLIENNHDKTAKLIENEHKLISQQLTEDSKKLTKKMMFSIFITFGILLAIGITIMIKIYR